VSTLIEVLILICIFYTLGLFLTLDKTSDTSNSYIHPLFKPIDRIMLKDSSVSTRSSCIYFNDP
jgi:hypothetical protein